LKKENLTFIKKKMAHMENFLTGLGEHVDLMIIIKNVLSTWRHRSSGNKIIIIIIIYLSIPWHGEVRGYFGKYGDFFRGEQNRRASSFVSGSR
jgi:hypothetical protein